MGSIWVLSGAERGLVSKLFGRKGSKVRIGGQWAGLVNQVEPALFPGPSLYYISHMLCWFYFFTNGKQHPPPAKRLRLAALLCSLCYDQSSGTEATISLRCACRVEILFWVQCEAMEGLGQERDTHRFTFRKIKLAIEKDCWEHSRRP